MKKCGLDECGRGALAGPLVAAGVIFRKDVQLPMLNDSKKLTYEQRLRAYEKIAEISERIEIGIISARQINNRGMRWANKEIFKRIIKKIDADKYIIDGNLKIKVKGKTKNIQCLINADALVPEVMAASIVAKVTRDNLMKDLHKSYPYYGWQTNAGYGTAVHIKAVSDFGMVRYHRSVYVTTALRSLE